MKDLDTIAYNPVAQSLVDVLCKKTQSDNPLFFHVLVGYYFSKIASMMRTNIHTHDRGIVPINMYALNLASSGQGKGHSTNIVEEQVIHRFKERFMEETFPAVSEQHLAELAVKRATRKEIDPDLELIAVTKEFMDAGNLAFSFDSGTTAAVKQMRHKLLLSNCGSMNMEIDEIGSNLMGNMDVLTTFLELFDVGKVKPKLTKNTAENTRGEEIDGRTPTNMMLFGTPSKLLNGGKTEEELMVMLETGYARRCIFGYSKNASKDLNLTPEQIYDMLTDNTSDIFLQSLSSSLAELASMLNYNKVLNISKDVTLLLIEYKSYCEKRANELPDLGYHEIQKAELEHRYFKALKLAGSYSFIEELSEITEDTLYNAIRLVEDSGLAFLDILTRERTYVKLANYLSRIGREVTHVDLVEDLPFYKGNEGQKRDLLTLAIAYGYKNNIIIKKLFADGIEFLKGESLSETDLNEMIISYSTQLADNYRGEKVPFDKLHLLTQAKNHHWANHHFQNNYRLEANSRKGFNIVAIDVDGGVSLDTAKLLLKEHKYLAYTTKSHTAVENRFRILFPMTHVVELDGEEFKEFMNNVYEWLPFEVDTGTNQRSKKWMSNAAGTYEYNDGELLNSLLFIPKTTKSEERKKFIADSHSLSNMERWFMSNTGNGNRSNNLLRYALMLVDSGMDFNSIQNNVLSLNSKLQDKLDETEVLTTIMTTAGKAIHKRTISP